LEEQAKESISKINRGLTSKLMMRDQKPWNVTTENSFGSGKD